MLFCTQLQCSSLNIPKRFFFRIKVYVQFDFSYVLQFSNQAKKIDATPKCPNLCVDRLNIVLNVDLTDPPKGKYQYYILITFRLRWYEL